MSVVVHSIKVDVNIITTTFKQREKILQFSMKCLWLCSLQECPAPYAMGLQSS